MKTRIFLLSLISFLFISVYLVNGGSADLVTTFTRVAYYDITAGTYSIDNPAALLWERDTAAPLNNHIRRSVIEWNISTIPDNAVITLVSLTYSDGQSLAGFGSNVSRFNATPSLVLNATQFYNFAGNGTQYRANISRTLFPLAGNNNNIVLSADPSDQIIQDLQAQLSIGDFFSLAIRVNDETVDTNGQFQIEHNGGGTPDPTLHVEWLISPTNYSFTGPFFENGTRTILRTNVTISGSNFTVSFNISNSDPTFLFPIRPDFVSWDIGSNIVRRIRFNSDNESIFIFLPEANFSQFAFTIQDFTGQLEPGNTWLETRRIINGTDRTIEREVIENTINSFGFSLVLQRTYSLVIVFSDLSEFIFGFFATLNDLATTLIVKRAPFSRLVILGSKFLFVEGTRISNTSIQINYLDTRNETNLLQAFLRYRNRTLIQELNSTLANVTLNFVGLDNTTDYLVDVYIDHDTGIYQKGFSFSGQTNFTAFPSFGGGTNTFGPMNGADLFPALIILGVALVFSTLSAPVGLFMTALVAGGLVFIDAITIPATTIVIVVAFAIFMGVGKGMNQ